jgi:hypothetical protein
MRKLILSSIVVLLSAAPSFAQHGDWCACGRHSSEPASFQIDHTTAVWQGEAATSFARWDAYSDVFSWAIGNGAGGSNGINEILFFGPATTFSQYGLVIDTNTFGVTYIDPREAFGDPPFNACPPPSGTTCGFYSETDVVMNTEFSRGWTSSPPNFDDTGPANYVATAIHEMGHALGIHHNFDSLTTMNYYEDYATIYLSLSDAGAARGNHTTQARTTTDIGTYPFRFSGYQYSGTTVASASPSIVEQGDVLTLSNFTIEKPGSETLSNVRLRIYLSTNTLITTADHLIGTVSFSSFTTWWDSTGTNFTVPASVPAGTYYVGAIATYNNTVTDPITYNNTWVLDSTRRVTVTEPACVPDGFESDDSSGHATSIASGATKNHSICPVGDEDWSTFTLTRESTVVLETSGASGDTRMWLYDGGIQEVEFDDDDGTGLFSLIGRECGVDALPAGSYYVKVDEFGDNEAIDSYALDLTVTPCPCNPDAFESDNSSAQAKPIASGIPKNHSICPIGDEDWSTFTLGGDAAVVLGTSGVSGDTRMWLYDSGLTQIEYDDDDGAGLFSFIDRTCGVDALPSGTYFVQVDEFADNEEIVAYSLGLTATYCSACAAELQFTETTLSGDLLIEASSLVTLGENLAISGPNIGVRAPIVMFLGDTTIFGTFRAGNDSLCP